MTRKGAVRQAVARGADARVLVTAMAGRRLRVRALLLSTRRQTRAKQVEEDSPMLEFNKLFYNPIPT